MSAYSEMGARTANNKSILPSEGFRLLRVRFHICYKLTFLVCDCISVLCRETK